MGHLGIIMGLSWDNNLSESHLSSGQTKFSLLPYDKNWIKLLLLSQDVWQTRTSAAGWSRLNWVNCNSGLASGESRVEARSWKLYLWKVSTSPKFHYQTENSISDCTSTRQKCQDFVQKTLLCFCVLMEIFYEFLSTRFWTKPTLLNWLLL